ncbi:hypothetical protein ACH5RR_001831 [Cinchona calisaya]|uniref:Uncharacterized protein n=1 Tax=Cinchona calisaya TaxID=153742 RepID=A0ABD3B4K4_9GENT
MPASLYLWAGDNGRTEILRFLTTKQSLINFQSCPYSSQTKNNTELMGSTRLNTRKFLRYYSCSLVIMSSSENMDRRSFPAVHTLNLLKFVVSSGQYLKDKGSFGISTLDSP